MDIKVKIIEVKEVTTKAGQKFNAYKTVDKHGKKMDVRFTRDVTNPPTAPCTLIVEDTKCNVSTTRQYPILWIQAIKGIEETVRKSNVTDYFGDNAEDDGEGVPL